MKIVVLGRDGVINSIADGPVTSEAQWQPIVGSIEAIAKFSQANYRLIVVTNQPAVARGELSLEGLHKIHCKMHQMVASAGGRLDGVFFCPHQNSDECNCRKPRVGLYNSLMERMDVELAGRPIVGDSLRDLQCAMVVGAKPVLVKSGQGEQTLAQHRHLDNVAVFDDLHSFAEHMLSSNDKVI